MFLLLFSAAVILAVAIALTAPRFLRNAARTAPVLLTAALLLGATAALAAGPAAAPASAITPVIDFFVKIWPLLAALGLFHVAAKALGLLWAKAKIAAGKTTTKVDDFVVHLLDPAVTKLEQLVDGGDLDAVRRQVGVLKALARQ